MWHEVMLGHRTFFYNRFVYRLIQDWLIFYLIFLQDFCPARFTWCRITVHCILSISDEVVTLIIVTCWIIGTTGIPLTKYNKVAHLLQCWQPREPLDALFRIPSGMPYSSSIRKIVFNFNIILVKFSSFIYPILAYHIIKVRTWLWSWLTCHRI